MRFRSRVVVWVNRFAGTRNFRSVGRRGDGMVSSSLPNAAIGDKELTLHYNDGVVGKGCLG